MIKIFAFMAWGAACVCLMAVVFTLNDVFIIPFFVCWIIAVTLTSITVWGRD